MRQPVFILGTLLLMAMGGIAELPAQEWWVEAKSGTIPGSGSNQDPWTSLDIALAHRNVREGDTISVRPGKYVNIKGFVITKAGIRVRRDPATAGRVILDGGLDLNTLRNWDSTGKQKTVSNGMVYDPPVLSIRAPDVTVDGLEVRNGITGMRSEFERSRILNCHVYRTSQNGIDMMGNNGEVAFCVVHDVVLYNFDGQCLLKDPTKSPEARKGVTNALGQFLKDSKGKTKNMDWGQGITFHGDYPTSADRASVRIPRGGLVHDNLLWNAWSEGIGTFFSREVRLVSNTVFNVWRIGYYIQNADDVMMDSNMVFFPKDNVTDVRVAINGMMVDSYAQKKGISVANEKAYNYLTSGQILPDNSNLLIRDNITLGGGFLPMDCGGGNLLGNRQGASPPGADHPQVVMRGNLFAFPQAGACVKVSGYMKGSLTVARNVFVRATGNAADMGQFLDTTQAEIKPVQPRILTIADNQEVVNDPVLADFGVALRGSIVLKANLFANRAATDEQFDSQPEIADLRNDIANLRRMLTAKKITSLGSGANPMANGAPRIVAIDPVQRVLAGP